MVMLDFFRTLLHSPKPVLVWVAILMAANMIAPFFFLDTLEAKVVLAAILMGAVLQTAIFSAEGFVRLLGLGHIAWVPMVIWLWTRLDTAPGGSSFRYWILAVIVLNTTSLIIDAADVTRYLRGEKKAHVRPD